MYKRATAVLFLASILVAVAVAQTTQQQPTSAMSNANNVESFPTAVPTSTTIVKSVTSHLVQITVTNSTAGAVSFSLCDRQSSPICSLAAVSVPANSTFVAVWPYTYLSPNGFTVLASDTGLTWSGLWR